MLKLISFATPGFEDPLASLMASARMQGADAVRAWTPGELAALDVVAANRALFDAPRGAGYWAWKPQIILRELEEMADGDVLIYNDAGRVERPYTIDRPLGPVVDWVIRERGGMLPGIYIPQWGAHELWTKGECLIAMDCDRPEIRRHPQIQATFSIWQAHERSRAFVREWARWCLDPRAVADERIDPAIPDAPGFIDHRHDQSVLTNLVLRHGLRCFGQPDETVVGPYRQSPIDKDIGTLADRIAGRGWAIRRRLADEQLRWRDLADRARGARPGPVRAARYALALLGTYAPSS